MAAIPYRILPTLTTRQTERFWRKVCKASPDACWEWTGTRNRYGYGIVVLPRPETAKRKDWIASRIAFYLTTGRDPGELMVCHHCDNPCCCNPTHLYLGTAADNSHDASVRGRLLSGEQSVAARFPGIRRGEKNGRAKLDPDKVRMVRSLAAEGHTQDSLATQFGVTQVQISRVVLGKHWKHVA